MRDRPLLKIYGERNTGTNYLHKLVERNLDVELLPGVVPRSVLRLRRYLLRTEFFNEILRDLYFFLSYRKNLGWKHSLVKPVDQLCKYKITSENLSFVTITKNPYSWLVSLYKHPYHQNWSVRPDFDSFLIMPWRPVRRGNAPGPYQNPIVMWNRKNRAYLQLKVKFPTINLRYESLIADPEKEVARIGETFSLQPKIRSFQNIEESTKGDQKDFRYYCKYYMEEKWMAELTPSSIHTINKYLDDDLLDQLGYKKLA